MLPCGDDAVMMLLGGIGNRKTVVSALKSEHCDQPQRSCNYRVITIRETFENVSS